LIRDYVQRREPPLDSEAIEAMREALHVAAAPEGGYLALPEAVRNRCLEMCFALDERGDGRLVGILDAAEGRGVAGDPIYDRYPGLTRPILATSPAAKIRSLTWISTRNSGRHEGARRAPAACNKRTMLLRYSFGAALRMKLPNRVFPSLAEL
jgi:hypothetical protein